MFLPIRGGLAGTLSSPRDQKPRDRTEFCCCDTDGRGYRLGTRMKTTPNTGLFHIGYLFGINL